MSLQAALREWTAIHSQYLNKWTDLQSAGLSEPSRHTRLIIGPLVCTDSEQQTRTVGNPRSAQSQHWQTKMLVCIKGAYSIYQMDNVHTNGRMTNVYLLLDIVPLPTGMVWSFLFFGVLPTDAVLQECRNWMDAPTNWHTYRWTDVRTIMNPI